MSEQETDGAPSDPRDSGGGDPRQGVHGSGGYGDPAQDGETRTEDPSGTGASHDVPGSERDSEEGASPAEQETGQIGGA